VTFDDGDAKNDEHKEDFASNSKKTLFLNVNVVFMVQLIMITTKAMEMM
jgi:hypothetical protein